MVELDLDHLQSPSMAVDTQLYIYIYLFIYSTHPGNIKGRQYDVEMIDVFETRAIKRHDFIRSIFINISASNAFDAPVWTLHIAKDGHTVHYAMNTTYFNFLPTDFLQQSFKLGFNSSLLGQWQNGKITVTHLWVMVHIQDTRILFRYHRLTIEYKKIYIYTMSVKNKDKAKSK